MSPPHQQPAAGGRYRQRTQANLLHCRGIVRRLVKELPSTAEPQQDDLRRALREGPELERVKK